MSTKRNKKRYQREEKHRPVIVCTGETWLEYQDEDTVHAAQKGDMKLHPSVEALHTIHRGEYGRTGHAGYFRVDIYDGRAWKPVLLVDLFPHGENHFSKAERPIDAYAMCRAALRGLAGARFRRTYREHYEREETPGE